MTAQAVAKEMIRWGNGGSIAMIASMSGSVANRVSTAGIAFISHDYLLTVFPGPDMSCVQRLQSRRPPTWPQPCFRVGLLWYSCQHHFSRLHRDGNGGSVVREVP
jgi:hypothetical protein